jgi:uncharacterized protein YecE (DUF72 family)
MKPGKAWIGTSGWHYAHWVGPFYDEKVRPPGFLAFYARHFATVEINNTFYRLPSTDAVARWHDATPASFRFACKASRYITHVKRLKDGGQSTIRFFAALAALREKMGPILFQLPPNFAANIDRLSEFLQSLPSGHRYAFEFRDDSWCTEPTRALLEGANAAFCIHDLGGDPTPPWRTADFVYIRFHGTAAGYGGSYHADELRRWARRIRRWTSDGIDAYVYFNNDAEGHAVRDALTLLTLLEREKPGKPRRRT